MPSLFGTLFLVEVQEPVFVQFLSLLGADDGDLVIIATETPSGVADGMDVQF